jgi:hypothetical protein
MGGGLLSARLPPEFGYAVAVHAIPIAESADPSMFEQRRIGAETSPAAIAVILLVNASARPTPRETCSLRNICLPRTLAAQCDVRAYSPVA